MCCSRSSVPAVIALPWMSSFLSATTRRPVALGAMSVGAASSVSFSLPGATFPSIVTLAPTIALVGPSSALARSKSEPPT